MKKHIYIIWGVLLAFAGFATSATAQSLNVLYVTGGGYHDYEAQEELLRTELQEHLDIEWTVDHEAGDNNEHMLSRFDNPNWHDGYDAVIYNKCFAAVTDSDYIERITRAHYEDGVAAVVLHCSMHTYRDAETDAWDQLVGLETSHHEQEQRNFKIEPINRYHEVMSDFPDIAWVSPVDELYIVTDTFDMLIPLTEAYGPETDAYHPVTWLNTYGEARVVGTTAGHNTSVMEDDVYIDFIVKGLQWATR